MTNISKQLKKVNIDSLNNDLSKQVSLKFKKFNSENTAPDIFNEDDYVFDIETAKHFNFSLSSNDSNFIDDSVFEQCIHINFIKDKPYYIYPTGTIIQECGWTSELQLEYNFENGIKSPEKEEEKTSIEYKYGLEVQADENIRIIQTEKDSKVFQWVGNHWSLMTEQQGRTKSLNWLSNGFKQFASSKMASSCHETLKIKANHMPINTSETIIPLKNTWLKVVNGSEFDIISANKNIDIRYVINTRLNIKPGQRKYVPGTVPSNSKFHKYINSALPKKPIQQLVQEYCGYTLLNDNRFQKALVMEGEGANGKSVLIELMTHVHQNARSIRLDKLENFGLTPLLDASLVISAEAPKKNLNENELKSAISGDLMTIEGKGKDLISHKPTAKWLIACNTFPHIDDKTNGLLRRLIIVPFETVFSEKEQIKDLDKQIIKEELDIVLNWCLEGLQRLLKRGNFEIPEEIVNVKQKKQEESDTVRRFSKEYGVAMDINFKMTKQEIYDHYRDYSENEGTLACGQEEFWKRMRRIFPSIEEKRKVIAGQGKHQQRVVNLQIHVYEPTDPTPTRNKEITPELESLFRQWKAQEEAKINSIAPSDTNTSLDEDEAIQDTYEQQEEEMRAKQETRIKIKIKKADDLLHKPEPKPTKTWELDGVIYKFKPAYLKALEVKNNQLQFKGE